MGRYRPLSRQEQIYLARFIHALALVARDERHPMRLIARKAIEKALWRWTADGVDDESGAVRYDVLKYDVTVHWATQAARARLLAGTKKGLRHEHVVPRKVLAGRIVKSRLDADGICRFLRRFCRAAIITAAEDRQLQPRCTMPNGWKWRKRDIYCRYHSCGIALLPAAPGPKSWRVTPS